MSLDEIRKSYLEFFEKRGHKIIPSSSLAPEGDATTLFTGSGMQPLLPYLLGKPHPAGKRLADSQKSFRAEDIEEVGDNRHTTFFEMLGNWSLGDYFKAEQLPWIFEFLTEVIGLEPRKLYVTVFAGDEKNGIPRDGESAAIWRGLFEKKGMEAREAEILTIERGGETGMRGGRIFYYDSSKNWWSRVGKPENMPAREPGGPDSEVFYEFAGVEHDPQFGKYCHPNCDCGRFLEIGNSVFMEYIKTEDGDFEKLPQRNVDFGGGLERIAAAVQDDPDIFRIDVFRRIGEELKKYNPDPSKTRSLRIVLDHIRAAVFIVGDGVVPSNKDRGYVLRRLVRRAMVHAHLLEMKEGWLAVGAESAADFYKNSYPEISEKISDIRKILDEEYQKFKKTLSRGLEEFKKIERITGGAAFNLHQSYGFPFELTKELVRERGERLDEEEFKKEFQRHQEISRAGQEKKFGGHGLILSTGELKARTEEEVQKVTRLHTATHMLQQVLRDVLGLEVKQMGSDITVERTRFDFSFPRKLSPEEIKKIENVVNQKVKEALPMQFIELPIEEAKKTGALYFFREKYPEKVKVYFIGRDLGSAWSKEFCGGPHVKNTSEVGSFKIVKEEAVAAGVRRIRGIVD